VPKKEGESRVTAELALVVPQTGSEITMTTGNTEVRIGRVVTFFTEKGFGFLAEDATDASGKKMSRQHFFHITSCNFEPRTGMVVQFRVGQGKRGPAAVGVELYEPAETKIPGLDALSGKTSSTEAGQ